MSAMASALAIEGDEEDGEDEDAAASGMIDAGTDEGEELLARWLESVHVGHEDASRYAKKLRTAGDFRSTDVHPCSLDPAESRWILLRS